MKNFYVKQKAFSIRDRYKVYDANQNVIYHCEGKMFSWTNRVDIYETHNKRHIFTLSKKVFSFMPTYFLDDPNGNRVAFIKKNFAMLKQSISIETTQYGYFHVEGNVFAHQFTITSDKGIVVTVQKKLFSWGDTYEVAIDEKLAETDLMIAFVIMIDSMLHNQKKGSSSSSSSRRR
ncbi:LURP-one-related/scramblase family protein [Liberiplasma polymorphum]|uniref:LURP-one-related/scramblase family protein n=1 Tax=Liberiplasma polymorphum TaxID=3374570 RepID=UPI0037723664